MASIAFKRYSIYWVELDPTRGRELRKTRPAVIVSRDELNRAIDTVVVCPMTSRLHPSWPTRLQVKFGSTDSEIAVDQIRAVSKIRLRRRVGELTPGQAKLLREILQLSYAE